MKQALVILSPGFPADENDSSCLPTDQQFVLSLKKLHPGKEIIVLSFQYPFEEKEYRWHNVRVIALGGKNRGKLFRGLTWLKAYARLKQVAAQYRVQGIISFWATECAMVAQRFARGRNMQHLIWIHGQDAKANNVYVRRIRPKPQQLVAMSDFLQDEFFKNHGIKPAHVIENGINASAFPAYNTGSRPIDISGAGSLIPLKNYSLFINLVAALKKSFPDIKAIIAGDGEERQLLQNLIEAHGLQNNVTLAGLKTHREVLQLMSESKVFLHTSHYEGNPAVLIEALYSGCQAISTRPLSHNLVRHLFTSNTKEELLVKLQSLFSQQQIAQERVVFNTMDESARRMAALFGKQPVDNA